MLLNAPLMSVIVVDLIAITILAGPLYFRRHRRKDLMLSYVALNVGVMGVALALAGTEVGIGLGLGLFGVLSIVRLRSDQISQAEIAYYFSALALGLLAGIGSSSILLPAGFAVLVLTVLYVVDHPRMFSGQRRVVLTLDRAYLNETVLRDELAARLDATITRAEVERVDLVRETTVVDVRYRLRHDARSAGRPGSAVAVHDIQQTAQHTVQNTAPYGVPQHAPQAAPHTAAYGIPPITAGGVPHSVAYALPHQSGAWAAAGQAGGVR